MVKFIFIIFCRTKNPTKIKTRNDTGLDAQTTIIRLKTTNPADNYYSLPDGN